MKKVLILGGTADGRKLAQTLHKQQIKVIYSVAGLVRRPDVACDIISGGFTQYGGLSAFIEAHAVGAILDVTHPYANKMSDTAVSSAKACGIPCWRFHRESWEKQAGDKWTYFQDWSAMLSALTAKKSLFLTAGQLPQRVVEHFMTHTNSEQKQLLRTAVLPSTALPASCTWMKAIGPFDYDDEYTLMQSHRIDVLVSKDSGGESTFAKLVAARQLAIPVYMLERPSLAAVDVEFTTHHACEKFVIDYVKHAF